MTMTLEDRIALLSDAVTETRVVPTAEEFRQQWPDGRCPIPEIAVGVAKPSCEDDFAIVESLWAALYDSTRASERLRDLEERYDDDADAGDRRAINILANAEEAEAAAERRAAKLIDQMDAAIHRRGLA